MFSENKRLSYGITTGSAATAASLAAIMSVKGIKDIKSVKINVPFGELEIEVNSIEKIDPFTAKASIIKKPYGDLDVTIDLEIIAEVIINKTQNISIKGGKGVGEITKPGLQIPVGEAAINPIPRSLIKKHVRKFLQEGEGAEIIISIPQGEEMATKTMNPRLGIQGGLSILGTTGISRPMSDAAYKYSLECQLDVALALGYQELIYVPGNIGENLALQTMPVQRDQIIQMSNFVGYMLEQAVKKDIKRLTIYGHAGKLVKIAGGIFNTKHSVADARREIITAHAALQGASLELIRKLCCAKSTEEMIDLLNKEGLEKKVFQSISLAIKEKVQDRFPLEVEVIIVRMDGTFLN